MLRFCYLLFIKNPSDKLGDQFHVTITACYIIMVLNEFVYISIDLVRREKLGEMEVHCVRLNLINEGIPFGVK